ncbi:MAG TPA: BamA/TamA family outer membrane protein, partial [Methylomirabilota bacterium]|nr:BamA/TamA family outer membrane protein [Methylomirabilota bacterium]
FERVETQPQPTDVPDRRNLEISVVEKNTGTFSVGAGFSSVNSIVGFVEMTQGNFDIANPPSFMGGGQKMRLRATLGFELQDYQVTFIEPWFLEKKLQFSTDLYHRDLDFVSIDDTYSETRTGGRVGLTRALGSDFLIGGISYTLENVGLEVNENLHGDRFVSPPPGAPPGSPPLIFDPANASEEILREDREQLVSKLGFSLTHDTRNHALLPTKGGRVEFRAELAGGALGGESDFYKLELRGSRYFRGFMEGHIFEIHGRIGVADSYSDTEWLPLFDSFFLGGIDTLRGYRFRQVGPKDEFEEPIGGGTFWYGSAEYSIPIIERLRFALFYDVGMVYRDAYSFDHEPSRPDRVNTGFYNDNWGVGLRLNLPIGPLRLDYGIPIKSDDENESSGRFQFSVGYTREF